MHRNENFRKMAKIFIIAFLCSEMHSSFTQQTATENITKLYPSTINGTEAILENVKYQASIRLAVQDVNFGEGHICSGALIAPSVVLTAAHCLFNYGRNKLRHPAELKVAMGSTNRFERTAHTLVYGITHVYTPDAFDAQTLQNNIAILMLERDVPVEHPTVQPITLGTPVYNTRRTDGSTSSSWGATETGLPITNLIALNTTHLNDQMCSKTYGVLYATGMLCAEYQDISVKIHAEEVGAPLLANNRLIGLRSFGLKSQPAVYTDISHHSQWILHKIGPGTNQNSSIWGTLAFLSFTIFTLRTTKITKS